MDRQGLPVSVGTDVFSDTTDFLASLRVPDRHQHQALEELLPSFVRLTHQPTTALNKHNPDAVWGALRILLITSPYARLNWQGSAQTEVVMAVVPGAAAI